MLLENLYSFPIKRLLPLYEMFHTMSAERAIGEILELIQQSRPEQASDYQIYRAVRLAHRN